VPGTRAPKRDSSDDAGLDPSGREVSNDRCARGRYRSKDPVATRPELTRPRRRTPPG
jgi:hypothetical protein